MDVSLVVSPLVAKGPSEGPSSFIRVASSIAESSQPNDASASQAPASTQAPSSDQVAQAVKQVNDTFSQRSQNIYATIEKDKVTGIDVVKFVDKDTKETISQYPPKAILAIAQALQQSHDSSIGQLVNAEV